jgi:hypothetical protein
LDFERRTANSFHWLGECSSRDDLAVQSAKTRAERFEVMCKLKFPHFLRVDYSNDDNLHWHSLA